jgi:hypothetical protein
MSQHCFFGYLTHPGLEYDIAIGMSIDDIQKFTKVNKLVLSKDKADNEYKFGILLSSCDRNGIDGFTCKAYVDGKLRDLFIYKSQYAEIVAKGNSINITQEGKMFENLLNLQ